MRLQADLLRLVNDAHAAAGDLLQQFVIAEVAQRAGGPVCAVRLAGSLRRHVGLGSLWLRREVERFVYIIQCLLAGEELG